MTEQDFFRRQTDIPGRHMAQMSSVSACHGQTETANKQKHYG
ncbi:hypothetical protein HMPREF0658_1714 [Hoylesella marshii DSM 16973 = JCM 13450]|uniref:Uncharacterized protein n=1 Tax=Hoylesella marshii DSM 16973 = JCM 13450 TaxID=862515 RepID=E0NU61_9BACT|nr:hypothetical protein HMPREF0658_1714 [Hoylesella marshii DSM 16973 = JCM 13450]